jgi:hypothetical protein
MTVLGFLSIVMFCLHGTGLISSLSLFIYGNEEEILEQYKKYITVFLL